MKTVPLLVLVALVLAGCRESDRLLKPFDFQSGDWLLVNKNYQEETLELIDDEKILEANKGGLWFTPLGDCGHTTCDGFISLYKDGKLIAEKGYLVRASMYESGEIKSAYKNGKEWTIEPADRNDFKKKWDSLKVEKCYPTIYHSQPADIDIIWVYKTE